MTEDKGILIRNIFYMLSYAFQELRKNNYENIAAEDFDNVNDLLAEIISRGISLQLKQGLHRSYEEKEESLPTLRGKINIEASINHKIHGRHLLECEFDEYSPDNLLNRILKSTMVLLIASSGVKTDRKKALKRLMPFFHEVSETDLRNVRWEALRFDRNSKTYQMLIYLCYFVVQDLLLTTEKGEHRQFMFSDERMCRLFERFVLEYYKRRHPEFQPAARQIEWNIDKEKSPALDMLPLMKTDVFLTINGRTLIIDTKYYSKNMQEHYGKKSIISSNQNQIYTYVMNHDKDHEGTTDGMLLYAKTGDEIQPDNEIRLSDGNVIYYRNLDLNRDFEGIKNQLETFVSTIEGKHD